MSETVAQTIEARTDIPRDHFVDLARRCGESAAESLIYQYDVANGMSEDEAAALWKQRHNIKDEKE